jgi:hypothetical protein
MCVYASDRISGSRSKFWCVGAQNVNRLFFKLGWDRYEFHKGRTRIRYAKLVFWQPVRSAGDIVHSDASVAQNVDALFFMLDWDR